MSSTYDTHNRLQTELPFFSRHALKIKDKSGKIIPFIFNTAQQYLHARIEHQKRTFGRVRALILKGRQQGCCFSPEMRVLTSDYRWVSIGKLPVGEKIFAVDEKHKGFTKKGRKAERRMCIATVEAKVILRKRIYQIELDNGTILRATKEHRFLCRKRGADDTQWREVAKTKAGDYIRAFCYAPEKETLGFEDGWFSGLLDGEGSFGAYPQIRIGVSQVDGPVLNRARKYLDDIGVNYYELIDKRKHKDYPNSGKDVYCLRIDRMIDILRILIRTRPTRFLGRCLFNNRKLPKTVPGFNAWPKILSITPLGEQEVIDLQTSEKTFICEGIVSHNSTYVSGRYYHKTTRFSGKAAFILSHESKTTKKLFAIVERFHNKCPDPVKPETEVQNKQQLLFAQLESEYMVGTAGNEDVGRGGTLQYLHGSEVAFWENTDGIETGIMQSVADIDGTEIILESTANGMGNMFYQKCMDALKGKGDYILVFIPWFWQKEYTRTPPPDFILTNEEVKLSEQFKLDPGQVFWRRKKIEELRSLWKFRQEYPMTVQDAFVTSGEPLINGDKIIAARKSTIVDPVKPLILGVDPGRTKDPAVIAFRRGREFMKYIKLDKHTEDDPLEQTQLAGKLARIFDRYDVAKCFIDPAHGYGVRDILKELGYGDIVQTVPFNEAPIDSRYLNKRAEMMIEARDWVEDGGVSIPDDEEVHMDLGSMPDYKETSNGRMYIPPKAEIKKKFGMVTHIMDAFILTFAYPVKCAILSNRQRIKKKTTVRKGQGPLSTINNFRRVQPVSKPHKLFAR